MSTVPRSISRAARDATQPLRFIVDPEHVRGSIVGSNHSCAGARALREREDVADAYVNRSVTYVKSKDGSWTRYLNDRRLTASVESFDEFSGLFPPGEYTLRAVPASQTIMASRVRATKAKKHESGDPNRKPQRRPKTWGLR